MTWRVSRTSVPQLELFIIHSFDASHWFRILVIRTYRAIFQVVELQEVQHSFLPKQQEDQWVELKAKFTFMGVETIKCPPTMSSTF